MVNVRKGLSAQEAQLLALYLSTRPVENARSVQLTEEQRKRPFPEPAAPGEERFGLPSAEWQHALGRLERVTEELVDGFMVLSEAQAHCPDLDGASVTSTQTFIQADTATLSLNLTFLTLGGERSFTVTSSNAQTLNHCAAFLAYRAATLKKVGYAYDEKDEPDFFMYDFDSWQGQQVTHTSEPVADCPCRTGAAFPGPATDRFVLDGTDALENTQTVRQNLTLTLAIGAAPKLIALKDAPLQIKGAHTITSEVSLRTKLPGGHTYEVFSTDAGVRWWKVL